MTVAVGRNPTLADWRSMQDPDGNQAAVIEMLERSDPIHMDIPWMEGNLPNGLTTTVRTGIPRGTWRLFNQGIQPVKAARASMTVTTGMYEALNEVDKSLADLGGMTSALRGDEASATMQGMTQDMADALMYSDEASNPQQFMGLSPFYSTLDTDESPNAENIIDAGGRNANKQQSIWLVGWGPMAITGVVPQGSMAGLNFEDMGVQTSETAPDAAGNNTGKMQVYRAWFKWHAGLAVRDWRYAVRIANCGQTSSTDTSTVLTKAAFEDPTLMGHRGDATAVASARVAAADRKSDMYAFPDLLNRAVDLIPMAGEARLVFYMKRDALSLLRTVLTRQVGVPTLTWEKLANNRIVYSYMGIPIRVMDALRSNEAQITAS